MKSEKAIFDRNVKADNLDFWEQSMYVDLEQEKYLKEHPDYTVDTEKTDSLRDDRILLLNMVITNGDQEMKKWAYTMVWVETNGFIKWYARERYHVSYATSGPDLYNEILQNAYLHLFDIVLGFDPDKGSYSTYIRTWMQKYIAEDISKAVFQTENVYIATNLQKLKKYIFVLEKKDISITVANIAEIANMPLQRVETLLWIYTHFAQVTSYDAYEDNVELNVVSEEGNPEESILNTDRKESVERAVSTLTETEQFVLRKYYDLAGTGEARSTAEIAKQLGKSSEHVRKIMHRAYKKLKRNVHLKGYGAGEEKKKERITRSEEYAKFWDDEDTSPLEGYAESETDGEDTYFE